MNKSSIEVLNIQVETQDFASPRMNENFRKLGYDKSTSKN